VSHNVLDCVLQKNWLKDTDFLLYYFLHRKITVHPRSRRQPMTTEKPAAKDTRKAAADTAAQVHAQVEMAKTVGTANLDALAEASAHAIEGAQACIAEMADYARTSVARNFDLMERLSAVKTPQEFMAIQIEAGKESVNRAVAQTTMINRIVSDSMIKASAPLSARANETVETVLKPYAA